MPSRRPSAAASHVLDRAALRHEHYNATLVEVRELHEHLRVIRVRPDFPIPAFNAGQYTVLGLGMWEPRRSGTQFEELDTAQLPRLAKRAYSISCSVLDGERVVRAHQTPYLEFLLALVRTAEDHPPILTPRLFALAVDERLYIGPKIVGHYTLAGVAPTDDVLLLATGTGEAPHNAMLAELLAKGHAGRIVAVTCVRERGDLPYLEQLREVERRYANFRYLTLTTREPENVDPSHPNYVGKMYVQDYFVSGALERMLGAPFDPLRTHAFACGNPTMVGAPQPAVGGRFAEPPAGGIVAALVARGFRLAEPDRPGNIHFEEYW